MEASPGGPAELQEPGECRLSIRHVNAGAAAALALIVGLAVGALLVWIAMRRSITTVDEFADRPIEVPAGASQVLAAIGSSGVVVGPHDEVVESTAQARTIGIVRGNRIAIPTVLELVQQTRADQVIRGVDIEVKRGSAGRRTSVFLSVRVAPLGDNLIVVLAEDRTSAVRVEQTRRDFVANVSHELKTPIGAVGLLAEAVEGAAEDPEAVHRFAGRLGIESQRLSDLVSQIIDLSRVQADDPLVQAELIDIDDILTQAIDRCRVDAERRNVMLTVAGDTGCQVLGSERQLSTAVGNLVENAIIYSDPGARVALAAHRATRGHDDYIEITVSDNGIGIASADLERIFERFYRVDYARSRANGGTGLGLSIVKHIAAAHGGEVSVWSQPGQGSTFTVSIPAPAPQDHPAVVEELAETAPEPDTGPRPAHERTTSQTGRRSGAESLTERTYQTQEIVR